MDAEEKRVARSEAIINSYKDVSDSRLQNIRYQLQTELSEIELAMADRGLI